MSRYLRQRALRSARHPFIGADGGLPADQRQFYERLGETDAIQFNPEIDQDEVFDDQFERRAHEIQRTPGANNAMAIIPSRTGPWTGNNNLGIERAFAPDANNRQTVIKLPEWGFPETWTLCLGLTYDPVLYESQPNAGKFTIVAEIEFGTGGVIQIVEVDWKQGTSIVLPMNALNVVASYSSEENEAGTVVPPSDLRLRANIVRGVLPQSNPTRSFLIPENAVEAACPVPAFAKALRLMPASPLGIATPFSFYSSVTTVSLQPFETSGTTIADFQVSQFVEYLDIVNLTCGRPVSVPIPDGSRFVNVAPVPAFGVIAEFEIGV